MSQKTIGIIGGGQLGRMLTQAAKPMGFSVVVLDPTPNSPASQVGAEQIVADFYDKKAIKQLAKKADYITVEFEHLDADVLEELSIAGNTVHPSPKTIKLIQDKYLQKKFLKDNSVAVPSLVEINGLDDARNALKQFGGKMILKTRYGAYDGRGNAVVRNVSELEVAHRKFKSSKLFAEELVPFTKELAVMVARSASGKIATYPVVETIQARNICQEVLVPASIGETEAKLATNMAIKTTKLLKGAGVFGIEMFLTKAGDILINEIAPRVHNSGHYTIEACYTSQFEQHVRAIADLPLGDTGLMVPAAATINILGERSGPIKIIGLDKVYATPHTNIHIYGKSPTKVDRKMGHITAVGDTVKQAQQRARKARKVFDI